MAQPLNRTPAQQEMLDAVFAKLDALPDSPVQRKARMDRIVELSIASGRFVLIEEGRVHHCAPVRSEAA